MNGSKNISNKEGIVKNYFYNVQHKNHAVYEYNFCKSQIGNYELSNKYKELPEAFMDNHCNEELLYLNIKEYEQRKQKLVDQYKGIVDTTVQYSNIFRCALIELVLKNKLNNTLPHYKGTNDLKIHRPDKAAILLGSLLGKDGVKLYKLALEEECHSPAFRIACFVNSLGCVHDVTWDKRPTMVIGGPSASGKSYATHAAMYKYGEVWGKLSPGEKSLYISIDGGIVRATSQMRKYIIQLANQQGFSGVFDLHKQSKALRGIKSHIFEAARHSEKLGIVIPETFSDYMHSVLPSLVKKLLKIPKSCFVPVRVCCPSKNDILDFKKTVVFQGITRAWGSCGSQHTAINLNISGSYIPESKHYSEHSFYLAQSGSNKFEKRFKNSHCYMRVINDRILIKKDNSGNDYTSADIGDMGAFLCSKELLLSWRASNRLQSIDEYIKQQNLSKIQVFNHEFSVNRPCNEVKKEQEKCLERTISKYDMHVNTFSAFCNEQNMSLNTPSGLANNIISIYQKYQQEKDHLEEVVSILSSTIDTHKRHLADRNHFTGENQEICDYENSDYNVNLTFDDYAENYLISTEKTTDCNHPADQLKNVKLEFEQTCETYEEEINLLKKTILYLREELEMCEKNICRFKAVSNLNYWDNFSNHSYEKHDECIKTENFARKKNVGDFNDGESQDQIMNDSKSSSLVCLCTHFSKGHCTEETNDYTIRCT